MGLYDTKTKTKSTSLSKSTTNETTVDTVKLKKITLFISLTTAIVASAYFIYPKFIEYKRDSYISNSLSVNINAFTDDEFLHDIEARKSYSDLRNSFIIVLGKISAYHDKFHTQLDPEMQKNIKFILDKNIDSIKKYPASFKFGRKEGFDDINPIVIQYGVAKQLDMQSLDEAKYTINWLIKQNLSQTKTLLELRYDIHNNQQRALSKLEELANEED